ncbi:MAG TPA: MFS transporter [Spirochaetia bacterium]|nr:MFS transporter [Spirochaetales bacterium]HRY81491.1 MFS transporter [Spirochaetia bacterium]
MPSWKRSFYVIWFAELIAIAGFNTTTPIIPLFLRDLGITDPGRLNYWNGLSQSASALALALLAPVWGSLADGYGRKPMILRAMFGGAALISLMALTTEPWQVFALRTLQGCVTGTVAAATVFVASIVPKEEAGYRLGLLQMAIFLGGAVGPLFGGFVADAAGPRVNFLATGAFLALSGLLVLRFVREDFIPVPRPGSIFRNALPDLSPAVRNPALAALLLVTFAVQFASQVAVSIMTLLVFHLLGDVPTVGRVSGLLIGAGTLAAALSAAAVGRVSGRVGYGRTLMGCIAGALVFYVFQGFARTPAQLFWFRIGSGIFLGGTMPSVNALIARLCEPGRQGSTYGLSSSVSSAGAALGPAVGALVAATAGYPFVFFTASAILLGTGLIVVRASAHGITFSSGSPSGAPDPEPRTGSKASGPEGG